MDDGLGMSDPELEAAMQLGAKDPRETRAASDLGRFGMGLKTASFSQARRLTVASKQAGATPACLRWDLDRLADGDGDWTLLEGADPAAAEALTSLDGMSSGTIVLWENLDRIVTEGFTVEMLFALIDEIQSSLAMTFHRLLEGPDAAVVLKINGKKVKHWDPFLIGHPGKGWESPEFSIPGAHPVKVQCNVLPHKDRLSANEAETAAGPAGWSSQQGFYVYRNRRLLVAGGWLRLGDRARAWTRDEPHRLARIRVDITNAADVDWKINVLKSTANPPINLRPHLKRLGEETRIRARRVFAHRGRLVTTSEGVGEGLSNAWETRKGAKGTSYRISRKHELVASVLDRAGPLSRDIEALLRLVEEGVPVQRIWLDTAEEKDTPINDFSDSADDDVREVLQVMFEMLTELRGLDVETAKARLSKTSPFDRYPALVTGLK